MKNKQGKGIKQEIAGASHIETAYEPMISNEEFTLLKVELITERPIRSERILQVLDIR